MVSDVAPGILPEAAVIVVTPAAVRVASFPELMLAIPGAVALHITELVAISTLPSFKVPLALNCRVFPAASGGSTAVIRGPVRGDLSAFGLRPVHSLASPGTSS